MYHYLIGDIIFSFPFPIGSMDCKADAHPEVWVKQGEFDFCESMHEVDNLQRLNLRPRVGGSVDDCVIDWQENGAFWVSKGITIVFNKMAFESKHFMHFLLNEIVACVFFQRNYFLLHASAVMLPNEEACVFFGEPGAGKSTTMVAFLEAGCQLLSDDLVIVSIEENLSPMVLSFLPQLKLWKDALDTFHFRHQAAEPLDFNSSKFEIAAQPIFKQGKAMLKYLFFIQQVENQEFNVKSEKKTISLLRINQHFPLPDFLLDTQSLQKRFLGSSKIIEEAETFSISRNSHSFTPLKEFVGAFLASKKPEKKK
jgi:hypothetical protein